VKQVRQSEDLFEIIKGLKERLDALERSAGAGNTSIDSGELTIRGGNIVVRDADGTPLLSIIGGDQPLILMEPDGGTDFQLQIFGWESVTQGAALQLGVVNLVGGAQNGGKLLLMRGAAYLSHQPEAGPESFYSAGVYTDGELFMKGKFGNNRVDVDGEAAVVCGSVAVAAGVSSYAHTYSVPSDGTMVPVVQMVNTAGALGGCLTAMSNTGFTFAWTGTLAKTINYWAFRI
jgi:hypothetical protein